MQEHPAVLADALADGGAVDHAVARYEQAVDHVGIVFHAELEILDDPIHGEVVLDLLVGVRGLDTASAALRPTRPA